MSVISWWILTRNQRISKSFIRCLDLDLDLYLDLYLDLDLDLYLDLDPKSFIRC